MTERRTVEQAILDLSEQIALRYAGVGVGGTFDLADMLGLVAKHMGQAVDATSARICSWESETDKATVLAGYVGQRACAEEEALDLWTSYAEADPLFLTTLLAGRPWVHHVDDLDLPADDQNRVRWYGSQTILFIPFHVRGRVVCFAELRESRRRRRFTPEEITLCQAISRIAALAVENACLHEQVQRELTKRQQAEDSLSALSDELAGQNAERTAELTRTNAELVRQINKFEEVKAGLLQRNRELLSLQSAAAATTACLDFRFVLETVTWEMANLLEIEGCAIYEWSKGANALSVIAEYGAPDREGEGSTGQVYDLADYPLREQVLAERHAQQLTTSQPDADHAELARMQEAGIKTLLVLPMVFQDRVVGLVEVHDSGIERTFTDHEISLAQFLTTQAASAVENARLYERAQREITERMRAEEQIKASLKEKEVLLKEIHHRVKNNLQVVSSLLNLQSHRVENQAALEVLRESQNRIRSMALIHERLYRSKDLARVDFAVYIRDLATQLVRSYRAQLGPVDLKVEADGVFLGIDTAIPCGLITNELISNSLKHAFPNGKEGEIRVKLGADGDRQFTMIVGDNGVGFPENVDFRNTDSLGMQLVTTLVDQLEGSIELNTDGGTEFKVTFAAP